MLLILAVRTRSRAMEEPAWLRCHRAGSRLIPSRKIVEMMAWSAESIFSGRDASSEPKEEEHRRRSFHTKELR
ncbi:hypothetical protein MRX96_014200 [Rhipicephalus microplus]